MRDHLASLIDDFLAFPREVAVVRYQGNRRRVTTYGELAHLAGRFAALLAARNIELGDRVMLWGENSAEWIAAFHGCMLRGVLAVPLDSNGTADFAARVAADVKPKLVIGDILLLEKLKSTPAAAIPTLAFENSLSELPATELGAISSLSNQTPLQILFTSGTTGEPKGIVLTHGNVLASVGPIEDGAKPYMRYEKLVHPLRILHTLPLSHVFGQTMGLWVPPILRAELHFEARLAAPRLVELIHSERISVLAAVPRILALLKTHLEITHEGLAERVARSLEKKTKNPWTLWWRFRKVHREFGLKFWAFVSGGGALPGPLEQFWNALGFLIIQGYGMTETSALITLNHPFHVAQGSIGKPLAGREVKLGPDGEVLVRGAVISNATWQNGAMRPREDEWLATGDIAERTESGDLRFLGRKSEVIVTAAGLNLHPEDIEAAIEEQPEVAACAVVPMQTEAGPEPCAVLALRGAGVDAESVIERANAKLAEFQRIRRWVLWPEPDLPRTSTGKVKRKPVAAWLARMQAASATSNAAAHPNGAGHHGNGALGPSSDWLLALIAQISGEAPPGVGDELRLTEDFHLDSLSRVQLAAAIEERLGIVQSNGLLEEVQTLGDLRHLVAGGVLGAAAEEDAEAPQQPTSPRPAQPPRDGALPAQTASATMPSPTASAPAAGAVFPPPVAPSRRYRYPTWPWWKPVDWIRRAFVEAVLRPFVWFLVNPRVVSSARPLPVGPMLIIANHITSYDTPLMQYALPGPVRRNIAVAMSGEMLDDFRHWRNPWRPKKPFFPFGPPSWFLVTALFNVFPLQRQRDFQASFMHAGKALDHGYNVMVFPEGALLAEGRIARFRPGIGLLVKQSSVPVLPMALRGLSELKFGSQRWFRSGTIEVVVGDPITFPIDATETAITARLQEEVEKLLGSFEATRR
jgi:long-chain acyl-CoA synthetase